jgi:D-alanyl-D-alanine carboxypeptidase (penicillin-binding protein 5/6)
MKTGHTQTAGYCLIASAKRTNGTNDRRLVSVVLGTVSDGMRAQESQKLLNWGFLNFDTVKLYAKGQPVATPEVWKGSQSTVKLGFTHDVFVTVPRGMAEKMKPVLERKDPLVAPIAQHSKVGVLKIVAEGKTITELPLIALEEVPQASIFGRAWDSMRLLIN